MKLATILECTMTLGVQQVPSGTHQMEHYVLMLVASWITGPIPINGLLALLKTYSPTTMHLQAFACL